MLTQQACFLSWFARAFNYAARDTQQNSYPKAIELTKTAIIEEVTAGGKKDFFSIEPYQDMFFSVSVDHNPFSYPFCDEIYDNVPPEAYHPLDVCRALRNAETCEYSYSKNTDSSFRFSVYSHDEGLEVYLMNAVLEFWLYVNGECRLRAQPEN